MNEQVNKGENRREVNNNNNNNGEPFIQIQSKLKLQTFLIHNDNNHNSNEEYYHFN